MSLDLKIELSQIHSINKKRGGGEGRCTNTVSVPNMKSSAALVYTVRT